MATDYFTMMRDVVGGYGKGVDIARTRQYEDEKRERETTTFNDQQKELAYQRTERANVDNAVQNYGLVSKTGVRNQTGIDANNADFEQAVQATGQGLAMPTQAPQQAEWTPASPLAKNQAMMGVALAKKDMSSALALETRGTELEWDDEYGTRLKEYKGTPEQIAAGSAHTNLKSGTLTVGQKDKDGFIEYSVTRPDGSASFSKLSMAEQAQMYAAGGMLHKNPTKALAILAGINKDLAASVATDNGLTEFLGKNTNDVAAKRADLADKAAGRAETSRHNRAAEGVASAHLGIQRTAAGKPNYVQLVDQEGNAQMVNANALPEKGGVLQLPPGMKYLKQRPEVDLQAVERRAVALEGKPMAGLSASGKPRVYDADTAYSAAMTQLYPQQGVAGAMSSTDQAIAARLKGGSSGGADQSAPGPVSLSNEQLSAIARKPRGVSSQEASRAQQELDNRRNGAPTLKAW